MAVKYIFCYYVSILFFRNRHQVFQETEQSLSTHFDLIKRHCKAVIEGVDQLLAAEAKRTFHGNSLLSPLLKVDGFNSIRIKLRTERNKYSEENFN